MKHEEARIKMTETRRMWLPLDKITRAIDKGTGWKIQVLRTITEFIVPDDKEVFEYDEFDDEESILTLKDEDSIQIVMYKSERELSIIVTQREVLDLLDLDDSWTIHKIRMPMYIVDYLGWHNRCIRVYLEKEVVQNE